MQSFAARRFWRWRRGAWARPGLLALLAAFLMAAPGCPRTGVDPGRSGPSARPDDSPLRHPPDVAGGSPRQMLLVRLRLSTIEVPVGAASGSEEIWSYLNEESMDPVRSASLGRNGIRIGLGRKENWPDLKRIFHRLTGLQTAQSSLTAVPGRAVPIVFAKDQSIQTIATSYADRTLSLCDYPPGDNLIAFMCTLDPDDPSKVLVTGVPQIRSQALKTTVVADPTGKLEAIKEPEVFAFSALMFRLSVSNNDLLVIGPSAASGRPHSVGRRMLVKDRGGVEFETVFVLIPEVFAAPIGGSR